MGYVKRDAPSAPRLHAKKREEERLAEKRTPLPKPPPIKTEKEKEELRVSKQGVFRLTIGLWGYCY